jgi:hypothetical protein
MSFTQDEYIPVETSSEAAFKATPDWTKGKAETGEFGVYVNPDNTFAQQDYAIIIKTFELDAANWTREDYAKAYHYRDVYSTRNFAERTRLQMRYYPGMHQVTGAAPETDPFYTEAKKKSEKRLDYWDTAMDSPDAFMSGLRQSQEDFDYTKIFGSDVSAKTRAENIGRLLTECVPCFDRLLDPGNLLPDGDLLEIHALNIKVRTDILDKVKSLFKDPGAFVDICELLNLLKHLCPQDLLAILALLTQYLAKLNLDVKFNIDFIIQLVGPILSPFLDALSAWLDKWVQLILGPIICVIDHINETILIAQSARIPLAQVGGNIDLDVGVAGPGHVNIANPMGIGGTAGLGDPEKGIIEPGALDPKAGVWGNWEAEVFRTPDSQKYNPTIPDYPLEETELAALEIDEEWDPALTEEERRERDERWKEMRAQERAKRQYIPPPLRYEQHDGTRWSKDDIPNSEKYMVGGEFEAGYHPPEKQAKPIPATEYYVTSPIVASIVHLRNILQGAVQYVRDWFTYVTQMVHDLLGTDLGWMTKKADTTMLKSRLIQLIMLVKAMIKAVSENGLECGTHTNFNPSQMKFILEGELNRHSATQFEVQDDGTVAVIPPGRQAGPDVQDHTPTLETTPSGVEQVPEAVVPGTVPGETISAPKKPADKQKFVESGTIIKDCFKNVAQDELEQVRSWIADFEKRGSTNG